MATAKARGRSWGLTREKHLQMLGTGKELQEQHTRGLTLTELPRQGWSHAGSQEGPDPQFLALRSNHTHIFPSPWLIVHVLHMPSPSHPPGPHLTQRLWLQPSSPVFQPLALTLASSSKSSFSPPPASALLHGHLLLLLPSNCPRPPFTLLFQEPSCPLPSPSFTQRQALSAANNTLSIQRATRPDCLARV